MSPRQAARQDDRHQRDGPHRDVARRAHRARADPQGEQRRAGPDVDRRQRHQRVQPDSLERTVTSVIVSGYSLYVNGHPRPTHPRREAGADPAGAARRGGRGVRRARLPPRERRGDHRARRLHPRAFYSNFASKEQLFAELLQSAVYAPTVRWPSSSSTPTCRCRAAARAARDARRACRTTRTARWMFRLWLELLAGRPRRGDARARGGVLALQPRAGRGGGRAAIPRARPGRRRSPPRAWPPRSSRWTSASRSSTTWTPRQRR